MNEISDPLLESILQPLDQQQRLDVIAVAGAYRQTRVADGNSTECLRAAVTGYRHRNPDDVDEAVNHSVGRILSIADEWINSSYQ